MLFGHQNDDANGQTQPADIPPPPPESVVASTESTDHVSDIVEPTAAATGLPQSGINPLAVDPATGVSLPVAPTDGDEDDAPAEGPVLNQPNANMLTPSAPIVEPEAPPMFNQEVTEDTPDAPATPADTSVASPAPVSDDLLSLKQKALSDLSPLVSQLDQTPEEKFRTTMMLIQSADDETLLPTAYEAAQAITDEKVRAQALLDVVNEINYFTQQKQD